MAIAALTCSQTTDMYCSIAGLKHLHLCASMFHPVPFTAPHVNRAVQEHLKLDVVNYMRQLDGSHMKPESQCYPHTVRSYCFTVFSYFLL